MYTITSFGKDEAICEVFEWLELVVTECLQDIANNFFTPTFNFVGFICFSTELAFDSGFDDFLNLILELGEAVVSASLMLKVTKETVKIQQICHLVMQILLIFNIKKHNNLNFIFAT